MFKEICYLTNIVSEGIESRFGRLPFPIVKESEFTNSRMRHIEMVMNSKHFDESTGIIDLIQKIIRKG